MPEAEEAQDYSVHVAVGIALFTFILWLLMSNGAKKVEKKTPSDEASAEVKSSTAGGGDGKAQGKNKMKPAKNINTVAEVAPAPAKLTMKQAMAAAAGANPQLVGNASKLKKLEATDRKDHECFGGREVGGHAQPIIDISFSSGCTVGTAGRGGGAGGAGGDGASDSTGGAGTGAGMVASVGEDRQLRCMALSDVGAATPLEMHCTLPTRINNVGNKSSSLSGRMASGAGSSGSGDGDLPTCITMTANARRILVGGGSCVNFFKVPVLSASSSGSEDKKLLFHHALDCSIDTSSNRANPYAATGSAASNISHGGVVVSTSTSMSIHRVAVLDVEKWMVVVISGDLTVHTTVPTASLPFTRDMMRNNNVSTVMTHTIPFVRAYNHSGNVIFTLSPTHHACAATVGGGIGGYSAGSGSGSGSGGGFGGSGAGGEDKHRKEKVKGSAFANHHASSGGGTSVVDPQAASGNAATSSGSANQHHDFRVSAIEIAVSPDSRYIAITGCGSHEASVHGVSSESAGADPLGMRSSDVGVFTVSRSGGSGEATGLTLMYVLSGHLGPIRSLAWCHRSTSLASLCQAGPSSAAASAAKNSGAFSWYIWDLSQASAAAVGAKAGESAGGSIGAGKNVMRVGTSLVTPTHNAMRMYATCHTVVIKGVVVGAMATPVSVSLMRSGEGDISSSVLVVAAGTSLYFYDKNTGELLRTIERATLHDIRALHGTFDGLQVCSVVGHAKRAPLWKWRSGSVALGAEK